MTDRFELAEGFTLGPEVATQVTTILGQRDSGKTFAGMKLMEGLYDFGVQVVVLDPVGVWWSEAVRGTGSPLQILVLGGQQGDVPLGVANARRVARLLVGRNLSAVLDLSLLRDREQQRVVEEFCDEFFVASRESRYPRTLVVEEAHKFVPQGKPTSTGERLGDIVRIGRNFGLGTLLISQRPQSIDKEVLTQTSLLMVGRMRHNLDVSAIEKWVEESLDGIKTLPQGTFFVWSADHEQKAARRVLPKRTLDASKTPRLGQTLVHERTSSFDLGEIRRLLLSDEAPPSTARAGDEVITLRQQVARLKEELAGRPVATVIQRVEVPVVPPEYRKAIVTVQRTLGSLQEELDRSSSAPAASAGADIETVPRPSVLLWVHRLGSLTLEEAGVLLGFRCDSGEFKREFSRLVGSTPLVLHAGRIFAREPKPEDIPPVQSDETMRLVHRWRGSLSAVQTAVLRYAVESWPLRPSIDDAAAATGYSPRSGSLRDAPRILRRLGLLDPGSRNHALAPSRVLRRDPAQPIPTRP